MSRLLLEGPEQHLPSDDRNAAALWAKNRRAQDLLTPMMTYLPKGARAASLMAR